MSRQRLVICECLVGSVRDGVSRVQYPGSGLCAAAAAAGDVCKQGQSPLEVTYQD